MLNIRYLFSARKLSLDLNSAVGAIMLSYCTVCVIANVVLALGKVPSNFFDDKSDMVLVIWAILFIVWKVKLTKK